MQITSQHVTGFVVGVGSAAVGYYLYKKNQDQIDDFLRKQGIQMPHRSVDRDFSSMTLEDLVKEKEHLEDLIAEKQMVKSSKE